MNHPKYSVIVPVYNRPQELVELLESLTEQTYPNFEVIVVEDGSSVRSENVVDRFRDRLKIHYMFKPNSGPGPSRNAGYQQARGDYFVAFDSDCILPPTYFEAVEKGLKESQLDAWGGPDRAHENFTVKQQAMGYTMASVLTTGGIRGGKKRVGWFQPRSFNMGISKEVFAATGGFQFDRYAEDIEFSIRIRNQGFRIGLIPEAFVFHKRRATFRQFYKQVFNFGRGRVLIGRLYPEEIRLTHWFPSVFVAGVVAMFLLAFISFPLFQFCFVLFVLYLAAIAVDAGRVSGNARVALLSVPSALIQFFGYGLGFLKEKINGSKAGRNN